MDDVKDTRLGTMVHTIVSELANHYGKKLDRPAIDLITSNLTMEMCQGETAWAFSGKEGPKQETEEGGMSEVDQLRNSEDKWYQESVNLKVELDAQRLRADTAEAELEVLRQQHAEQSCIFCNNSGELLSKAAEQRIADYEFALMHVRSQIDYSPLVAYIDAALSTASPATINQQGEEA